MPGTKADTGVKNGMPAHLNMLPLPFNVQIFTPDANLSRLIAIPLSLSLASVHQQRNSNIHHFHPRPRIIIDLLSFQSDLITL